MKVEELEFILDRLIFSKSTKFFMVNNAHMFEYNNIDDNICIFAIKLNSEKTILNIYRRKEIRKLNHYFLDSAIEVLLELLEDEEIDAKIASITEKYQIKEDLSLKIIQDIIDEIFFDKCKDYLSRRLKYEDRYIAKMSKMMRNLISNNEVNSNLITPATPSLFEPSLDQALKKTMQDMILKILQKIGKIVEQNEIVLTTVLIQRPRTGLVHDYLGFLSESGEYEMAGVFGELEQNAETFASAMRRIDSDLFD